MKVTIGGSVTPGSVCAILRDLEKEYGVKIRDLTMYIRFVDEKGHNIEPRLAGNGNELVLTVHRESEQQERDLTYDELLSLIEKSWRQKLTGEKLTMVRSLADGYYITEKDAKRLLGQMEEQGITSIFYFDRLARHYLEDKRKKQ